MSEPVNITPAPPPPTGNGTTPPVNDQAQFDEVIDRDSRIVLGILGGIAVLAALVMSTVALVQSSNKTVTTAIAPVAAASTTASAASKPAAPARVIEFSIEGSIKKGPDGKLHDAFSMTEFKVKTGEPVELKIDNKDASPHSITSALAGVNIVAMPGVHSYTLEVKTAGKFEWKCIIPCDSEANGWAMNHPGYMAGYITAT